MLKRAGPARSAWHYQLTELGFKRSNKGDIWSFRMVSGLIIRNKNYETRTKEMAEINKKMEEQ